RNVVGWMPAFPPIPHPRLFRASDPQAGMLTLCAMTSELPQTRRNRLPTRARDALTWLRVGGPADWLFQPADAGDLADFLRDLDPAIPVFPMGVGSNLIVRDGGIRGVVIRLGRGFNTVTVEDDLVTAGAAALDAQVA